jgi:hypothetical protein
MRYIYTNNAKWDDAWFCGLSNDAKILFYYISEKCDNAGFYEINKKVLLVQTNLTEAKSRDCFTEIKKAYIMSNDKSTIWLKNYIKHQRKLPLNSLNKSHIQIIKLIKKNLKDINKFHDNKELIDLLPIEEQSKEINTIDLPKSIIEPKIVKEPKSEPTKRFVVPNIEEVKEYMILKNIPNAENESINFFNFYESKGWKVGKNPMKSWKSAVDGTWSRSLREKNKDKFSVLEQGFEATRVVDWNQKLNN